MNAPDEKIDKATEAALRLRAQQLAERRRAEDTVVDREEMLVVQVGRLQCAVPLKRLSRVTPATEVTPIPGAPTLCAGIAYVDGRIMTLVDLGVALGHPPIEVGGILILESGNEELALGVTGYLGVRELAHDVFRPPPTELDLPARDYVAGVDAEGVASLDINRLARDLLEGIPTSGNRRAP